jgi:oligoendopeptidase F
MTYEPSEWDLSELFDGDLDKALNEIEEQTKSIEAKRDSLSDDISSEEFLDIVELFAQLRTKTRRLGSFVGLKFSEDSSNHEIAAMQSKVDNFLTKISNRLIFFSHWFKELNDEKAKELIEASGNYKYHFEGLRRSKPYTLKEKEEQIINIKDTSGIGALESAYEILTSQFEYDFEGKKLNRAELTKIFQGPDREKREQAYKVLFNKYEHYKDVLSMIYSNVVTDWREENVHLRGFESPIHVRNFANDIPNEAIEALLNVVKRNYGVFQRYFEVKRKKLG